jgi:hypothetical protein
MFHTFTTADEYEGEAFFHRLSKTAPAGRYSHLAKSIHAKDCTRKEATGELAADQHTACTASLTDTGKHKLKNTSFLDTNYAYKRKRRGRLKEIFDPSADADLWEEISRSNRNLCSGEGSDPSILSESFMKRI